MGSGDSHKGQSSRERGSRLLGVFRWDFWLPVQAPPEPCLVCEEFRCFYGDT